MRSYMRGFTLIEILVVVTILAIAATIAVPSISSGYDSVRVPSSARMVMSDILYAQNTAVTRQQRTFVYFMQDTQSTPRTAYTIASFPGQPSPAPSSVAFNTIYAATGEDFVAGTIPGKILIQPTTKNRYLVQFGANNNENSPGPLSRTIITSVRIGSSTATVFGFDSLGEPIDVNGTVLTDPITIEFSNLRDDIHQELRISAITGEIDVP